MKFISRIVPHNNDILTKINRNIIIQAVLKKDKNEFTYYDIVSINGLNNHLLKLFHNNNFIFTDVTTAAEKSFIENDLLRDENTVYNLYMDLDIIINNFENNKAYMHGTIYRIRRANSLINNGFKPLSYKTDYSKYPTKKLYW